MANPSRFLGDGTQLRAFTHINDVAPIVAGCVGVPGARNEIFNIGADKPYAVNDSAHLLRQTMGTECKVVHLDARNEVKVAFADHSKALRVFGEHSPTSLQAGIRAMTEWVMTHGARESNVFENIEVMKNLPLSWASVARKATAV